MVLYDVRPPPEIEPGLYVADVLNTYQEFILRDNHISGVVSLVGNGCSLWQQQKFKRHVKHHLWIRCDDTETQDLIKHMNIFCDFLDEVYATPRNSTASPFGRPGGHGGHQAVLGGSVVLVHCEGGVSRSPTMVIAYLMRKYGKSRDAVLAEVKGKRKIRPNPGFMDQLEVWEQVQYQPWEDKEKTIPKAPYKAYLERRAVLLREKGLTGDELPGMQTLDF
ncbi:hypothetical protein H113_04388 [Trichophyton rubrum MR1459]|uniref:protein-tyrosine-phosphatase n=3 Tax=Trichophyton TaxID=5550 RepID=F2SPX8_TRIRC|nr:uncharacterized protein TERG_04126 [Trichophyton rubrum CBS 118892]EZF63317.1 hypothetical protein H104_04343 [Trichophyton rubrum CBS 289.86]EZF73852.1 hypothetical protein H105_04369 [Trichophyton soudanense CBS 452.61]EZF84532.1 hypothetical protein H110_04347 [Trichophyton rubrum MR1448]EZF95336.1 hypothetical protein H113_04388 [Trichophyton rubrum MR1459]EGD87880.2 hypothetical protein TERG_04126 [Trichophyton rubrum CBS 118892]